MLKETTSIVVKTISQDLEAVNRIVKSKITLVTPFGGEAMQPQRMFETSKVVMLDTQSP